MKATKVRALLVGVLLAAGLSVAVLACSGGDDKPTSTAVTVPSSGGGKTTTTEAGENGTDSTVEPDELSTFENKDPFIPQAVPVSSSSSSTSSSLPPTTSTTKATTTTIKVTTTTKATTTTTTVVTTTSSTTTSSTTTSSTTTTTTTYLHTLDVLSIGTVGSTPVVTFQVDSLTYTNKVVGDVVSTTWGDMQVLAIDVTGQYATFLHGSETVTLRVSDPPIHE